MTKKQFDQQLKQFGKWGESVRNTLTGLRDEDEISEERMKASLAAGFAQEPMATFLKLTGETAAVAAREEPPPAASFDEFMASVARSMVSTQQSLDLQSSAYLASVAGQPHIQPQVFRMPRLEAQLKFELNVSDRSKINLLFWGKSSERTELNQQGLNFEIVAVPAPPGALESARQALRIWTLVLDPARRDGLLGLVRRAESGALTKPVIDAAVDDADAVAFLDLGDGSRTLVLYAQTEQDKDVGIWLLTEEGALEPVYRFNKSLGPEEVLMRDLVLELAAQQKTISGG